MTVTPDPVAAAAALREAMALLARAGELEPCIESLALAAWNHADVALAIAVNEAKLAKEGL